MRLRAGSRTIDVADPDKILYPAARFTKEAVIAYYTGVARFLLPHLRSRPVALKRFPDGIHGESFWEKDAPTFTPSWVKTVAVPRRDASEPPIRYIVIADRATLAWVASIAALEIHPFLHRAKALDTPTSVVFDLDPGEGSDVLTCAHVAFLLKDVLDRLSLASLVKVSGSKGLQVYVPLNTPMTYAVAQPFAKAVAELLEREHRDLVVADMAKSLRARKVFIDWSQNADHKTTVGVYSLRAKRHRPYVSMPVTWDELAHAKDEKNAKALYFDAVAAMQRLLDVGDLFAPVLTTKQALPETFVSALRPSGARTPRSLATYAEKRHFAKTSEPAPVPVVPRASRQGGRRRFVIQKHAASHLHYDLRLESQGVLHSWSVPKGMPYALDEKRLAVATEDHPLDYLTFEGVIPKGEYGGGTVMVWDIGTCDVIDGNYWKGALHFFLEGRKLKGEWRLTRDSARGEKAWSLVKAGKAMRPISAKRDDQSALTGRTMAQIARERDATWRSNRTPAVHAKLAFVEPMQCKLVARLPQGGSWLYEIKYDGYRALGINDDNGARLLSRNDNDLSSRFPRIAKALSALPPGTMVDGEIVALGDDGRPRFKLLHRVATPASRIFYYVFDVLVLRGEDVRGRPLRARRKLLEDALANVGEAIHRSQPLAGKPSQLAAAARENGLEGLVAKREDSVYEAGERSGAWQKLRVSPGQELVVGGYIPGGTTFDALLVGYYDKRRLIFIAKIRNGFVPAVRRAVFAKLRPLVTGACPFANLPESRNARRGLALTADAMKRCVWLEPKLVAQVEFTEWTDQDHLRHARFMALREDKPASEVTKESAAA
jgi:bifunctional non-homologous end joining protein LigD